MEGNTGFVSIKAMPTQITVLELQVIVLNESEEAIKNTNFKIASL